MHVSFLSNFEPECKYVPRLYAHGRFTLEEAPEDTHQFMIMQLLGILLPNCLGPNLSELRKSRPDTKFSSTTTSMLGMLYKVMLGMQMIRAIQSVHATGTLHRDIKPGNFCLGPSSNSINTSVYIIDFGLCRRFLTNENTIRPVKISYLIPERREKKLGLGGPRDTLLFMRIMAMTSV
jgi:serine/threonine protein kinase